MSLNPSRHARAVPFLSAPRSNGIPGYRRFATTRAYIARQSSQLPDTSEHRDCILQLMRQSGYADLEKFRAHRRGFDTLARDVPLGYLDAIGVERDVLHFTVEHDAEQHRIALKQPRFPRYATARLIACVYRGYKFPEDTPEPEAIEMLRSGHAPRCQAWFITYPDLLTVWVHRDRSVRYICYTPSVRFTRTRAVFSRGGERLGMVSV